METVEWKQLNQLVTLSTGERPPVEINEGEYPYINGGTISSGYFDRCNSKGDAITTPTHGEGGIGFVDYQAKPFWCGALCIRMYGKAENLDLRYVYYYLKNNKSAILSLKKTGGMPYLSKKELGKIQIPVPPLSIQRSIVEKLDACTGLVGEIGKELELRKKQYEHCREKLLQIEGGEWKRLGEVCSKVSNIKWDDQELMYIDLSSVPCKSNIINACQCIDKTNAPSRARQIVNKNDILFGTTRPTQMRLCVVPEKYDGQICSTGYCVLRFNGVEYKYAYYCLTSNRFLEYCDLYQEGGGYPAISDSKVKDFQIPVPSLSVQRSIVEKLDAFEGLIGELERELALREKQYEHLREKLLAFA